MVERQALQAIPEHRVIAGTRETMAQRATAARQVGLVTPATRVRLATQVRAAGVAADVGLVVTS